MLIVKRYYRHINLSLLVQAFHQLIMLSMQQNLDTLENLIVSSGYEMLICLLKTLFITISCCPMMYIDFIYYIAREIIVCKELCVL